MVCWVAFKMSTAIVNTFVLILIVWTSTEASLTDENPRVSTRLGEIIGTRKTVVFQGKKYNVSRFLGIPYAKPPLGEKRFKRSELFGAFEVPYEAKTLGAACAQCYVPTVGANSTEEDCLFLNIFVPDQAPDRSSGHAVMIFIHGGGFTIGSGNIYAGNTLASVGNVIVVTINYRLGVFGFLNIDDPRAPGNAGLWDQILALQWVAGNIDSFGGDKERITIFGESAGSTSVMLQALYPPNAGLFHKAICESGTPSLPNLIQENSIVQAKLLAGILGCNDKTLDSTMACLQTMDSAEIIAKIQKVAGKGLGGLLELAFMPSIDNNLIKYTAKKLLEKSETEDLEEIKFYRSIALINGLNTREGTMFLSFFTDSEQIEEYEISRETMTSHIIPQTMSRFLGYHVNLPAIVSKLVLHEYTDWSNYDDPYAFRKQHVRLMGDTYFNVPGYEFSRLHAMGVGERSYLYSFSATLGIHPIPFPAWLSGANHMDELCPVFGFDKELFTNASFTFSPEHWELELSRRMMTAWSNFAKTGDPNVPTPLGKTWAAFNLETQQNFEFAKEDLTSKYLYANEFSFWREIIPSVYDALTTDENHTPFTGSRKQEETCDANGDCDGI